MVSMDKQPKRLLSPREHMLFKMGMYLSIAVFLVAAVGLAAIIDQDNKLWISTTWFGIMWKWLIELNPMFSAFFVNFPLVTLIMCWRKIWDHNELMEEKNKKKE